MTHDSLAGFNLESDARSVPNSPALTNVSNLVEEWDTLGRDIKVLAARMDTLMSRRTQIERESLPAAMQEAGVTSFTTTWGREVEVKQIVSGNIPALSSIEKAKGPEKTLLLSRRERCLAVIRAKWPGLIKTELSVSLGKGQTGLASRVAELLRKQFELDPSVDESIHHQTLNSHFNQLKEDGKLEEIPAEPFGLYVGPIARIK